MANNIDEKIISLELENKGFEKAAKVTINTIENLKKALKFEKATDGIDTLEKRLMRVDFSSLEKNIASLSNSFTTSGIAAQTVIQDVVKFAESKFTTLYNNTIGQIMTGGKSRALNIANAQFKLEGLGIDWEKASQDINEAVSGTAYGFDEAANAASNLSASGVELGKGAGMMNESLKAISGLAAMTNSSYSDIANIMSDIAGQGHLGGMQITQFALRGLNIAAELAKQMGITQEEVRELTRQGSIDFFTFSHAMYDAYAETAFKANETFEGSMANMKAALSRTGAMFYTPYLDSMIAVYNSLREAINAVNKAITPLMETFGDTMHLLSKIASSKISEWAEKFKPDLEDINDILKSFNEYLQKAIDELERAKEVKERLAKGESIEKIYKDISKGLKNESKTVKETTKEISADLSKITDQEIQAAKDIWSLGKYGNGEQRRKNIEAEGMSYERVQKYLEDYVITGEKFEKTTEKTKDNLKETLKIFKGENLIAILKKVDAIVHSVLDILKEVKTAVIFIAETTLLSFLKNFFYMEFIDHYAELLQKIANIVKTAVDYLTSTDVFETIADTVFMLLQLYIETKWFLVKIVLRTISDVIDVLRGGKVAKTVEEITESVTDTIVDVRNNIFDFVDVAKEKIDWFSKKSVPMIAASIKFLVGLSKVIFNAFQNVLSLFNFSDASGLIGFIQVVFDNILTFISNAFHTISKLVKHIKVFVDAIIDFVQSLFGKVDFSFFKKLFDAFINAIANIISGLGVAITKAKEFLLTFQNNPVLENIRQTVLKIIDTIKDFFSGVGDRLLNFFENIGNVDWNKFDISVLIDKVKAFKESLPTPLEVFELIKSGITGTAEKGKSLFNDLLIKIGEFITNLKVLVAKKFNDIKETFVTIFQAIKSAAEQVLAKIDWKKMLGYAAILAVLGVLIWLIKLIIRIFNFVKALFGLVENAVYSASNMAIGYTTSRKGKQTAWQATAQSIVNVGSQLGMVVAALEILEKINIWKLIVLFAGLSAVLYFVGKLIAASKPVNAVRTTFLQMGVLFAGLGYLASQLAEYMKALDSLNPDNIGQVLAGVGIFALFIVVIAVVMREVGKTTTKISSYGKTIKKGFGEKSQIFLGLGIMFAGIGILLKLVTDALVNMQALSTEQILTGLLGMAAFVIGLSFVIDKMAKFANVTMKVGKLVAFLVAIVAFIFLLEKFGILQDVQDAAINTIQFIGNIINSIVTFFKEKVFGFLTFLKNGIQKVMEFINDYVYGYGTAKTTKEEQYFHTFIVIITALIGGLTVGLILGALLKKIFKAFSAIKSKYGTLNPLALFKGKTKKEQKESEEDNKSGGFFTNLIANIFKLSVALLALTVTALLLPTALKALAKASEVIREHAAGIAAVIMFVMSLITTVALKSMANSRGKLILALIGLVISLISFLALYLDRDGIAALKSAITSFLFKIVDIIGALIGPLASAIVYLLIRLIIEIGVAIDYFTEPLTKALEYLASVILLFIGNLVADIVTGVINILTDAIVYVAAVFVWLLQKAIMGVITIIWNGIYGFFVGIGSLIGEAAHLMGLTGDDYFGFEDFAESFIKKQDELLNFGYTLEEWLDAAGELVDDTNTAMIDFATYRKDGASAMNKLLSEDAKASLDDQLDAYKQYAGDTFNISDMIDGLKSKQKELSKEFSDGADDTMNFGDMMKQAGLATDDFGLSLDNGVLKIDGLTDSMSDLQNEMGSFDLSQMTDTSIFSENGADVGSLFADGISDGISDYEFSDVGFDFNNDLSESIKTYDYIPEGTADTLGEEIGAVLEASLVPHGEESAKYFIEGFANGIEKEKYKVPLYVAISHLTTDIMRHFNNGLAEHSPSRLTMESGRYFVLGFSEGIQKYNTSALKKVDLFASDIVKSFGNPTNAVKKVMKEDLDISPTIQPVIDYDGVRYGVNQMNSMLSPQSNMLAIFGGMNMRATTEIDTKYNDIEVRKSINELKKEITSLKDAFRDTQVVLDTGALVGEMAEPMDTALGRRRIYAGRRN